MKWADCAVIVPSWNHGMLLPDAIASVLTQSVQANTLVVVDDGSTDDTREVCSRFPVTYVRQDHAGVAAASRTGMAHTTEPWVFMLGADDMMGVDYIARHREVLEAYQGTDPVALVYCEAELQDLDGNAIGYFGGDPWEPGKIQQGNYVHACALVSRAAWDACGGMTDEPHEDWALWKRMDQAGYVGLVAEGTRLLYRQHEYGHRNHGSDRARARDWQGKPVRGIRVANVTADIAAAGVVGL